MHGWRGQGASWRDIVSPLKQEAQPHGGHCSPATLKGVLDLLVANSAAPNGVSDAEVSEDLAFLTQQLLKKDASSSSTRSISATQALCRLLQHLLGPCRLRMNSSAANIISSALRSWADSAHLNPGGTAEDKGLQLDALGALSALVVEHLQQVAEHERASILALLLTLAAPTQARPPSGPPEAQQLALQAITACCTRSSGAPSLSADAVSNVSSALVSALQACCGPGVRVVEDGAHVRLYAALLRALSAAIVEGKRAWVPHSSTVVECLRRLMLYGVPVAAVLAAGDNRAAPLVTTSTGSAGSPAGAAAAVAGSSAGITDGSSGGRRYQPPHLRSRSSSTAPSPRTSMNGGWSDSEASDSERAATASVAASASATPDAHKSSRVRIGLLMLLQSMAKSDSRALHQHWTSLLPTQQPIQARPLQPHLLTMLLHDPMPRVRSLAAATLCSLLEGPAQRAYLAVAEAIPTGAKSAPVVRGFTTLSRTLGQAVMCIHAGLLHSVRTEESVGVLSVSLRTLCVLLAAAPYERLPPSLLPEVLQAVRRRWALLQATATQLPSSELSSLHAAYLACVAEALNTKHASSGLKEYLALGAASDTDSSAQQPVSSAQPPAKGAQHTDHRALPFTSSNAHSTAGMGKSLPATGVALQRAVSKGGSADGSIAALGADVTLLPDLLATCEERSAVLRIEALAAVRGLARHYTAALPGVWTRICNLVACNLSETLPPPRSTRRLSESCMPPLSVAQPFTPSPNSACATAPLPHITTSPQTDTTSQLAPNHLPLASQRPSFTGTASVAPSNTRGSSGGPVSISASTSPEDKAAQHAVQLLAQFLASLCRQAGLQPSDPARAAVNSGDVEVDVAGTAWPSPHRTTNGRSNVDGGEELKRLAGMWEDAIGVIHPAATGHTSYMVRSAALGCCGEIPEVLLQHLQPSSAATIVSLLAHAAANDTVAAVRVHACKALGCIAFFDMLAARADLTHILHRGIVASSVDAVLNVRVAACWALANACDAVRRQHMAASRVAAAADARPYMVDNSQGSAAAIFRTAHVDEQQGQQERIDLGLLPHLLASLPALCSAALSGMQDVDKVRANGVRAAGNLLCSMCPGPDIEQHMPACGEWVEGALQSLQSSLTTGNMKVQWNACYATAALFQNTPLLRCPPVAARLPRLLLLLIMLVRDSSNFKIRAHAASALATLPTRYDYADLFQDALLVVWSALEALAGGGGTESGGLVGPVGVTGASGGAGTAHAGGEDEEADAQRFPNYKFVSLLTAQLRSALLHLLSLAEPQDGPRLRDQFSKRGDGLRSLLWATATDVLAHISTQEEQASVSATASSFAARHPVNSITGPTSTPSSQQLTHELVSGGLGSNGASAAAAASDGMHHTARRGSAAQPSTALMLPSDPFSSELVLTADDTNSLLLQRVPALVSTQWHMKVSSGSSHGHQGSSHGVAADWTTDDSRQQSAWSNDCIHRGHDTSAAALLKKQICVDAGSHKTPLSLPESTAQLHGLVEAFSGLERLLQATAPGQGTAVQQSKSQMLLQQVIELNVQLMSLIT